MCPATTFETEQPGGLRSNMCGTRTELTWLGALGFPTYRGIQAYRLFTVMLDADIDISQNKGVWRFIWIAPECCNCELTLYCIVRL